MNSLTLDLQQAAVPAGEVRLYWLGQAGFAFKTHAGKTILLDPYLSDACERLHGFKRLSLPAIVAEEVEADWVILTHEHTDHLDPDAIPVIARNNPQCRFAGPVDCEPGLVEAGVTPGRRVVLEPSRRHDLHDLVVHTVPADHGDISPSALTLLLDFGDVRVLVSGDSSWRPKFLEPLCDLHPDVVLPVINGVYGNMSHLDAAMMVEQAKPRFAIPCHFWTFAEQGAGDPGGFLNACRQLCPETEALTLKPGEGLTIGKAKAPRKHRTTIVE